MYNDKIYSFYNIKFIHSTTLTLNTATGIKSPIAANTLNRVSQTNTAYVMGGGSRAHSQTPTQQAKDIKKLGYLNILYNCIY